MKWNAVKTCIVGLILLQSAIAISAEGLTQTDVFISGTEGFDTFRIPAIVVTNEGTVLAFCEGRREGGGDAGDIEIVLRRSIDGGKTWSPMEVIWDDGPNTCGNPCPVVDRETGDIFLLLTHNFGEDEETKIWENTSKGTRTVWVTKSSDDGVTWTEPLDITSATKDARWSWYATGPGVGIQLTRGLAKGRLVVPCDHGIVGSWDYHSHVIYSDDHGKTWKLGGSVPDKTTSESQVVELEDGSLALYIRHYSWDRNISRAFPRRAAISISKDGGLSWSVPKHNRALLEPNCQVSVLRYSDTLSGNRSRILFSNPAGESGRFNMTVRLSYDEGRTWPVSKVIHPGPSAYSCMVVLPDNTIGCFYEGGKENPYQKIILARFSLDWLTDGTDKLSPKLCGEHQKYQKGEKIVMNQEFNWHDSLGLGDYTYGEGGYLIMDGIKSSERIQCYRFLKETIADYSGVVEVKMKVIFRKRYLLRLYDSEDKLVVNCCIDRDGWVKFLKSDTAIPDANSINTHRYLTCYDGRPCVDPKFLPAYTLETDLHTFKFGNFDFEEGSFNFTFDAEKTITITGCFCSPGKDIKKLEFRTVPLADSESGSTGRIRLQRYRQYKEGKIIDDEDFPFYWQPVPASLPGYPTDKYYDTEVRPVGNRWLEVSSIYGWVKAKLPCKVLEGQVEFEMMGTDVYKETAFVLMEYDRQADAGEWMTVGISSNRIWCEYPNKMYSDVLKKYCRLGDIYSFKELVPVADKIYKVKVVWYKTGTYRIWIDGAAMKCKGSYDIPFTNFHKTKFEGIDCISLHNGQSPATGYRLAPDKRITLSYYGNIKLKAFTWKDL